MCVWGGYVLFFFFLKIFTFSVYMYLGSYLSIRGWRGVYAFFLRIFFSRLLSRGVTLNTEYPNMSEVVGRAVSFD